MSNAFFRVPKAVNEPVKSYAPGSPERSLLKQAIRDLKGTQLDIPMFIDGQEVRTGKLASIHPPHELSHTLGHYHKGGKEHVQQAIAASLKAKSAWENTPWEQRASIFLKAADLLAGPYRYKMNAATMLAQSKNPFQAEIDAACELIDFWRFNVQYMAQLYTEQPESQPGMWNRMEHRPLEGFVFALTPFNFTSIGGNLPTAPAMMGNTVVWKTANTQIYSAWVIMEILREAGLPDGVINLVYVGGVEAGEVIFNHPDFAGIHFTGSTSTFQTIWKTIGNNIALYKSYPRIVGETGGSSTLSRRRILPSQYSRTQFKVWPDTLWLNQRWIGTRQPTLATRSSTITIQLLRMATLQHILNPQQIYPKMLHSNNAKLNYHRIVQIDHREDLHPPSIQNQTSPTAREREAGVTHLTESMIPSLRKKDTPRMILERRKKLIPPTSLLDLIE
jgi:hypothetical protein